MFFLMGCCEALRSLEDIWRWSCWITQTQSTKSNREGKQVSLHNGQPVRAGMSCWWIAFSRGSSRSGISSVNRSIGLIILEWRQHMQHEVQILRLQLIAWFPLSNPASCCSHIHLWKFWNPEQHWGVACHEWWWYAHQCLQTVERHVLRALVLPPNRSWMHWDGTQIWVPDWSPLSARAS